MSDYDNVHEDLSWSGYLWLAVAGAAFGFMLVFAAEWI